MDKVREIAIIEGFIRFGGIEGLSIRERDRERPDALLNLQDTVIGVEVTAIQGAQPRQAVAPQKWRASAVQVGEAARRAYEARNRPAVVAHFDMQPEWEPASQSGANRLASELAALVERTLNDPPRWPRDREPYTLRDPHPDVAWAYFSRSAYGNEWRATQAGEVVSVSEDDVRVTVGRKELKVATYRLAAPIVWLLIDCDVAGQGVAFGPPASSFAVASSFDQVFCCGFGSWEWVALPTQPPA